MYYAKFLWIIMATSLLARYFLKRNKCIKDCDCKLENCKHISQMEHSNYTSESAQDHNFWPKWASSIPQPYLVIDY